MPHASLRILDITYVTGNDMNIKHSAQLLVSCERRFCNQQTEIPRRLLFHLAYQTHAGLNLFRCQLAKAGKLGRVDH